MSPRVLKATGILRDFLFERVYNVQSALPETERARQVLRRLTTIFEIPAGIAAGVPAAQRY